MNEEERKPDGIYGHWVKQMIENGDTHLEDDIDEDDGEDYIQYDFGLYEDDQEETE